MGGRVPARRDRRPSSVTLACSYLFIEPRGTIVPDGVAAVVGLVAYLFTCGLIVAIGEAMRSAQKRVAASAKS